MVFGSVNTRSTVSTAVHVPPTSFWTTNAVSLTELSVHVSVPVAVSNASPAGFTGGSAIDTGRIMSISSWLRMWQ